MTTNGTPETESFTLAEMTQSQLEQPSAELDPTTGQPLSVGQLIEDMVGEHGGRSWTSMNGVLSEEAQRHNSDVTRDDSLTSRDKAGQYLVAVRVQRPVNPADRRPINQREQEQHGYI